MMQKFRKPTLLLLALICLVSLGIYLGRIKSSAQIPTLPLPTTALPITPPEILPTNTPVPQNPTSAPNPTPASSSQQPINQSTPINNSQNNNSQGNTSNTPNTEGNQVQNVDQTGVGFKELAAPQNKIEVEKKFFPSGRLLLPIKDTELIFTKETFGTTEEGWLIVFPKNDITVILNFSDFLKDATPAGTILIPEKITLEKPVGNEKITLVISKNTYISTSSASQDKSPFDGRIIGPKIVANTGLCNSNRQIDFGFEVGREERQIFFDKPVRMEFSGKNNQLAGYCLNKEMREIKTICGKEKSIKGEGECYSYEDGNLVVLSKHFTQFVLFKNQNIPILWIVLVILSVLVLGSYVLIWRFQGTARVDEYVATVVHDLRTPLTAIKGYLSMLRKGSFGPLRSSVKEPLDIVAGSAQQMSSMVSDILDVSKLNAGKLKLNISEFSIEEVVSEVIKSLSSIAKGKGVVLQSEGMDGVYARADKDKVRQILTNLVGNALKFTEKGSVTISSRKKDKDMVEVLVADTGAGISKEDQDRLFAKFEQAGGDMNKSVGTGLGLFISRELARKMGGDLWIESSKPGEGSIFIFSLPMMATGKVRLPDSDADNREIK